ncbi:TROVE domain-containing protein [Diaphorobacter sp. HDW4B]|uniref:TROVE domain-containing protein n=1 Tax=Diaphorobacter sp. HDW4B TaxID=2714925 RepID=UPI001407D3AB|nr:TROVE domain-containing protein [Diaphorobacter sp. HDW4B]QIL71008.1 TROVE domain-containing protein [Diaphorobacter sp. HDW4B]
MVNKQLFQTRQGAAPTAVNTLNHQNAGAYAFGPRHQLAQMAVTGALGQTFYASAEEQLDQIANLVVTVDNAFTAKTAIYARQRGYMKDMPATLAAALAVWDTDLLAQVFSRVVDNGKMLRNFVQIVRSGAMGRKSLGTAPKKLVQNWLLTATEKQLLNASVGNTPSLADVVKMVHPKPQEAWRATWFAWLIGKPFNEADLPPITQAFERFKREKANGVTSMDVPDVPFQMMTALELNTKQWAAIAKNGSWQMVRQNLNTFARHGVFEVKGMTDLIAAKLKDASAVAKARAMPYQLLSAFKASDEKVPNKVREALQDAMEKALANVPSFAGSVVVCPDVSGSMSSPVTGYRAGATTTVRCIDVAGLMAAAVLRKNREARVLPFEQKVVTGLKLNARDSVMTNATKLAGIGGGGTNCSAPLKQLADEKAHVDLVIMVSDNESWVDGVRRGATQTMLEWERIKHRNPNAKLVCIDIQPYGTTQAMERQDILNVGGFSDAVFDVVASFAKGELGAEHWVGEIEKIVIAPQ